MLTIYKNNTYNLKNISKKSTNNKNLNFPNNHENNNSINNKEQNNKKEEKKEQASVVASKQQSNDEQITLVATNKFKEKSQEEQTFNIIMSKNKISVKEQKVQIIKKVINDIQEQKSFCKVITKIISDENENTIITIAKNLKYFIEGREDEKRAEQNIIKFLIFESCSQGKLDILKKLQIVFSLNFQDFSEKFYAHRKRELDILTVAAKTKKLEIVNFLLEEKSLFISGQKNQKSKLIDKEEITKGTVDFQIPFMQYIFESDYNQEIKLQFTKVLLNFIANNFSAEEKTLIINYTMHYALKNAACDALSYIIQYAQDNNLKIELLNQGIFSQSNVEPSAKWNYKEEVNEKELAKTILEQQRVSCSQHLQNMFDFVKSKEEKNKNCFTSTEVEQILIQAKIFIEAKDNNINVLTQIILDNNSSDGQTEMNLVGIVENH